MEPCSKLSHRRGINLTHTEHRAPTSQPDIARRAQHAGSPPTANRVCDSPGLSEVEGGDTHFITRGTERCIPSCLRVYARVLVPPNLYVHTYIRALELDDSQKNVASKFVDVEQTDSQNPYPV